MDGSAAIEGGGIREIWCGGECVWHLAGFSSYAPS